MQEFPEAFNPYPDIDSEEAREVDDIEILLRDLRNLTS
jgi:hypothetical protein